jgi:hypothetical protein
MGRDKNDRVHLSIDEARGGEEIMRSNLHRFIFLAGLAGSVALVIILILAGLS